MDYFDRLLASLPYPADVWAAARRLYPDNEALADHYAARVFEGHYLRAKTAFASLLDPPDEEDDDGDGEQDTGDPGADLDRPIDYALAVPLADLEVPALEEIPW